MILNRTSQTKVIGVVIILMLIVLVPAVVLASAIAAKPNPILTSSRVQTAISSAPATPIFLPAVLYDSGGFDAMSVAVADMNGDGKADAVVSNYCGTFPCFAGTVSVLLGYGDGTFQGAVTYDTGGVIAESIAIADLNADGIPDVVVTNNVQPTWGSPGGWPSCWAMATGLCSQPTDTHRAGYFPWQWL